MAPCRRGKIPQDAKAQRERQAARDNRDPRHGHVHHFLGLAESDEGWPRHGEQCDQGKRDDRHGPEPHAHGLAGIGKVIRIGTQDVRHDRRNSHDRAIAREPGNVEHDGADAGGCERLLAQGAHHDDIRRHEAELRQLHRDQRQGHLHQRAGFADPGDQCGVAQVHQEGRHLRSHAFVRAFGVLWRGPGEGTKNPSGAPTREGSQQNLWQVRSGCASGDGVGCAPWSHCPMRRGHNKRFCAHHHLRLGSDSCAPRTRSAARERAFTLQLPKRQARQGMRDLMGVASKKGGLDPADHVVPAVVEWVRNR